MNRKSKHVVEHEFVRLGCTIDDWTSGQKHEIASVTLDGRSFEMSFSRGKVDEVILRRLIQRKVKEERSKTC